MVDFSASSVVIGCGHPGGAMSSMKDRATDEECVPDLDSRGDDGRGGRVTDSAVNKLLTWENR